MSETLEPQLTRFDVRVLGALAEWPKDLAGTLIEGRIEFRSAWVVAERVREYDVRLVRDTLRGLVHLGYAENRRWGEREEWIKSWRWRDA
jgi:hypothetical protein